MFLPNLKLLTAVAVSLSFMMAAPCQAGMLFSLGPNWTNFVFEPVANEDTPNYYGYGGRGCLGYSLEQVLDICAYGQYSPGKLNAASSSNPSAFVYDYGGELGARMFGVLYLGVRGGVWTYHLSSRALDEEIGGTWSGPGAEVSFGLLLPVGKQASWQLSLDAGQASVAKEDKKADEDVPKTRKLSRVSVTMSFVFNGYQSDSVAGSLFDSFFKSLF
jgi:hypothetical protein